MVGHVAQTKALGVKVNRGRHVAQTCETIFGWGNCLDPESIQVVAVALLPLSCWIPVLPELPAVIVSSCILMNCSLSPSPL